MFFDPPPVLIAIFAIAYSIGGAAIGLFSGWLTILATKSGKPRIWKDALLGALGFWTGFIGTLVMPWHENTITERLPGGGTVSTTMPMYQHPLRIGVIIAVIFPFIYELYRFGRLRKRAHS